MDIFEWLKTNPQPTSPGDASLEWKERLRAFASRRLSSILDEERRLRNRVMTGHPDQDVTAWTVPGLEVVQARAREVDGVEIIQFGDGSYQVHCRPTAEKKYLTDLARDEFAGDDRKGMLWALETGLLDYQLLKAASDRFGDEPVTSSESEEAALVASRFWLCLAHKSYGAGLSASHAYHLCGRALDIAEKLQARKPHDPTVSEFLEEAKKAQWSYDD